MGRRSKSSDSDLDRISELPVEIRLHILSLATTKSAVRVGAVSKKWAGLWASAPNIVFDQREFQIAGRDDFPPSSTASFVSFVDRALALRDKSVGIRRFELRWYHGFQIEKATPWLEYAVIGNTREMLLIVSSSSPRQVFVLPPSLLCCPSLEHWDLGAYQISDGSKSYARGLRRFGPSLVEINLGDTPLLESGRISFSWNPCNDRAKLARIFANFCNVKALALERCSVECLEQFLAVLDSSQRLSLPFPHLKCLTMKVLLNKDNIRIIIILLNWFSNLQKLVIYNYEGYDFRSNVNVLEDNRSPHKVDFDCGLNHLKEIKINGFLGVKDELEFVKLLLQNASTLRTMLLNYKKELRKHETWMEISQSLSIVSLASLNAEIRLSPLLNC